MTLRNVRTYIFLGQTQDLNVPWYCRMVPNQALRLLYRISRRVLNDLSLSFWGVSPPNWTTEVHYTRLSKSGLPTLNYFRRLVLLLVSS